jgi:nicotinamidase/pyrazinamidase
LIIITDSDALIAVDIQCDFLEGGSLGVHEGHHVVPVVNALAPLFKHVVFSRDWHPPNHVSFSAQPEYRDRSWPPHAVRDTPGAQYHKDLRIPQHALIVSKATLPDCEEYSGFQASGVDLAGWLRARGVKRLFLAGIATDYCVRFTALDGVREGFEVYVIEDAVRGVSPDTTAATWTELDQAGVVRVRSAELQRADAPGQEG